ncbi:MAG TPA: ROK family protein [Candidatus Hydrogenedentes bacterium]|nr:ROK family protein [Candidatus Hydrogenedentota bacterium]HRZ82771.1 ROK family protein [Candidatus Hydrogenedentota bacterium]
MSVYGGIEAGGTKFVCALGTGPDDLREELRFPTTAPEECIGKSVAFFREAAAKHGGLAAVGIASFGPLDPAPASPTFGHITTTPKPGWAHTDLAGPIARALGVPVGFDTDVNGAALGEFRWGAAQGMDTFVYITVGTGIGGGAMVNGGLVHGLMHPEMGHVFPPHDRTEDPFEGLCPYHRDCLEGLASGPAIERRWGARAETLSPEHPAWDLEAKYLAHGIVPQIYILSPQRVILGGGVMDQAHLFPKVRRHVGEILNGYIQARVLLEDLDSYIVPPGLGNRAGVLGAVALAQRAAGAD